MKKVQTKLQNGEGGFTLVELAIVLIIIGLLITGVLKGQEMIVNAQVARTITQVRGMDAAVSTFRDTYNALPGDMNTAQARLPNCSAATSCFNGTGNSRIDNVVGDAGAAAAGTAAGEGGNFFTQLSAADLITGVNATGGTAFGGEFPEASVGGGFTIGHTAAGAVSPAIDTSNALFSGHYVVLSEAIGAAVTPNNGPLTSAQAARIDRKIDDGSPSTGAARGTTGTCQASVPAAGGGTTFTGYDEANGGAGCSMVFRIQG